MHERIEFKINDSEGQEAYAIVRVDDIVDIVLRGPTCTVVTDKYEYMTNKAEYENIKKALGSWIRKPN